MRTKTQKEVGTTGLTFSNNGQRLEEKERLELNKALAQFFAERRTENEKGCLDNFAPYVINK